MFGGRGDQVVEPFGVLDLIAPTERLDDALDMAATLAEVLDKVEVFVAADLLDADEHGAAPCFRTSTTILCIPASKIRLAKSQYPARFSTTIRARSRQPQQFRGSQRPHHPKPQKLGQTDVVAAGDAALRLAGGEAFADLLLLVRGERRLASTPFAFASARPRAVRSAMRRRSSLAATPSMARTSSAKSDVVSCSAPGRACVRLPSRLSRAGRAAEL